MRPRSRVVYLQLPVDVQQIVVRLRVGATGFVERFAIEGVGKRRVKP